MLYCHGESQVLLRNAPLSRIVPIALAILTAVLIPSHTRAQPIEVEKLIAESEFRFGLLISSIGGVEVSSTGGYVIRVRQGTAANPTANTELLVGSTSASGPIAILASEGTITDGGQSFNNQGFLAGFLNENGQLAFTAVEDVVGSTNDTNAIVADGSLVAIEGNPAPSTGTFGNVFLRGFDNSGRAFYEAQIGGDSFLFRDSTLLIQTGDAIIGTTETVQSGDAFGDTAVSRDGTNVLSAVETSDATRGNDAILVLNGTALTTNGGLIVRERSVIGIADGGISANETISSLSRLAVNNNGDYAFGGFTSAPSSQDAIVFSNGQVVLREGDAIPTVDGGTHVIGSSITTLEPGVALNDDGDLLVGFGDTLILNGVSLFESGDTLSTGGTLNRVFDGIGISDRDALGLVTIYFTARDNAPSTDEALFRLRINPITFDTTPIPEPTTLGLWLTGTALLFRRRRRHRAQFR